MSTTALPIPFTVARTVNGRLQISLTPNGLLEVRDAPGSTVLLSKLLNVGDEIDATYELSSPDHCGSVTIQPMDWSAGCRGETSQVLGNVDFPYLMGTNYQARPQGQRLTTITVTFRRLTETTGQITSRIGDADGCYTTVCDIDKNPAAAGPTGASAAFIAYSETRSSLDATGAPTNTMMAGGGKVTLRLRDAAGTEFAYSIP